MKENTIRLYKHFCKLIDNPIGEDQQEREAVRRNAKRGKINLEQHFKKSRKYNNDTEILELLGLKKEVKEVSKNGKKSA